MIQFTKIQHHRVLEYGTERSRCPHNNYNWEKRKKQLFCLQVNLEHNFVHFTCQLKGHRNTQL